MVVGKKIKEVRWMTKEELEVEGWGNGKVVCLILDGGIKLYPSMDEEGNGGGALFGNDTKQSFYIMPRMR